MSNLFKIKYYPNPDGSDSSTVLNDSNTAFVHTYVGDDITGDGTRSFPYRSIGKALLKGLTYIVFRGVINEPFTGNRIIIGDDINQMIISSNYLPVFGVSGCANFTCDFIRHYSTIGYGPYLYRINTDRIEYGDNYNILYLTYSLFKNTSVFYESASGFNCMNSTLMNINAVTANAHTYKNNIVTTNVECSNTNGKVIRYTVFPSSCIFKYNGSAITTPSWVNDSASNMGLLKTALLAKGMSQINIDSVFPKDSFGNETCKIIKEIKNGGTRPNIFNRYSGDTVLDWTLNPNINNEALFASDTGGFVGCFKPNMSISSTGSTTWTSIKNVNVDGSDDVVSGTLLLNNSDIISFANNPSVTTQIWNRMSGTTVLSLPTGVLFNGVETMSTDGSPFGYYIGKHQELVDSTQLMTGSTLTVGNIYKVCNSVHVTSNGVTYNGNNYAPDYFFKCVSGATTFSLVTVGSGTYLQKLNSTPLESIEIIPYSDLTTVSSTYPKFSCPLSGDVKMLFYSASGASRYSKTIGTPVLFGDLKSGNFLTDFPNVCDKISYYNTWGITNADQEFLTLMSNGYFTYSTPLIKFLKIEMNGHFNAAYDY